MCKQIIFIALDDSGKLSLKEKVMVYGGIIFLDNSEKNTFIKEYQNYLNMINDKYNNKELKSFIIKEKDRNNIIDILNFYHTFSVTIINKNIYKNILENKKSKGRFLDYAIKIIIKNTLLNLIKKDLINPNVNTNIIINIDEQNYKSNGFYNLEESIKKELKLGMSNIQNLNYYKPLFNSNLELTINFLDSSLHYDIQASDIIAGTIRKYYLANKKVNLEKHYNIILP